MLELVSDMSILSDLAYYDEKYFIFCNKSDEEKLKDIEGLNDFQNISLFCHLNHKKIFNDISGIPVLYSNSDMDSQMCLFNYEDHCVLAFRGSNSLIDWKQNIKTDLIKYDVAQNTKQILVHRGFYEQFLFLKNSIDDILINITKNKPIYLTGHSSGGALATLGALYLAERDYTIKCITFGSPMVGNKVFIDYFNTYENIEYTRVLNDIDPVPELPNGDYEHINDKCIWLYNNEVNNVERNISPSLFFCSCIKMFCCFNKKLITEHKMERYMYELNKSIRYNTVNFLID